MPNFNVFMHRNNIFRKEPDFRKLACDYQELEKYMIRNKNNKSKFDFKNPDAVKALTCALLHRYFQKTITLPPDRLIPAVPQRLNYVCWVEDLIKLVEQQIPELNITGLDIGTGASCIFPILCCHRNPSWSFVGVEPDEKSYKSAYDNVERNFMQDKIRVVKITTDDQLSDILSLACQPLTFIMCNPPFFEEGYGVTMELDSDLNKGSRPKSDANCSNEIESITSGGEIAFVGYLIEQSMNFKEDVIIYSSMLGKKQSLMHFKQTFASLQTNENLSWTWAELCQGKTIRYAIAWTFKPGIDLTKAPFLRHGKNKSWKFRLTRKLAKRDCELEIIENGQYLKNLIFSDLMINKARVTKQTGQLFEIILKTNERNWTNQRRKRRNGTKGGLSRDDTKSSSTTSETSMNRSDQRFNEDRMMDLSEDSAQNSSYNTFDRDCNVSSNEADDEAEGDDEDETSGQANRIESESSNISDNNHKISFYESSNCAINEDDTSKRVRDENGDTNLDEDDDEEDDLSLYRGFSVKKKFKYTESDGDSMMENMDDIYDYLLCCRISLSIINHELYFELKLEHPCTAANDGYDLFQYFRNRLREKYTK